MRYSEYFTKVAELAPKHPEQASALLREAESYALQSVPEHLVLCARSWEVNLHDHDNAMRCMLEGECRANDCYMFLFLATAHLEHFGTITLAERCFRKAVNLAESEDDFVRICEFFETFDPDMAYRCRPVLMQLEQRLQASATQQLEQGRDG